MDLMVCSKCGKSKPFTDFYRDNRRKCGYASQCKDCRRPHDEKYYKSHKAQSKISTSAYRIKRWARSKAMNALSSHRRQGHKILVSIDYVEQLFLNTKVCSICGKPLKLEVGNGYKALHNSGSLDRIDNDTKLTENNLWILCYDCNVMKGNKTLKEFQKLCELISKNLKEIYNGRSSKHANLLTTLGSAWRRAN